MKKKKGRRKITNPKAESEPSEGKTDRIHLDAVRFRGEKGAARIVSPVWGTACYNPIDFLSAVLSVFLARLFLANASRTGTKGTDLWGTRGNAT